MPGVYFWQTSWVVSRFDWLDLNLQLDMSQIYWFKATLKTGYVRYDWRFDLKQFYKMNASNLLFAHKCTIQQIIKE